MECLWKLKSNIDWSNKFGLQKLQINIMIYCGWWQSRDPTSHHPNVVPGQDDGQPLHQLPGDLLLLLSQLSKELPCQLGEHVQGSPCQPPKESTAKGMNVMPSAVQRSSYLDISWCWTRTSPLAPHQEPLGQWDHLVENMECLCKWVFPYAAWRKHVSTSATYTWSPQKSHMTKKS